MLLYNTSLLDLGIVPVGLERVIQRVFITKIAFSLEWVDCLNVLIWGYLHRRQGYMILDANIFIFISVLQIVIIIIPHVLALVLFFPLRLMDGLLCCQ